MTAAVASSGPHSHKTLLQPFSAKILESILGLSDDTFSIKTFLGSLFKFTSLAVDESYTTRVFDKSVSHNFALRGKSKVLVKTTLKGSTSFNPRVVKMGLSFLNVFPPIIIGGNTLRKDNPILTTRGVKKIEPLRVVFTRTLDLPLKAKLWDTDLSNTLVIYDSSTADEENLKRIPKNVLVEKVSSDNPKLISKLLAERGYNKILWECGPKLATSAIKSGCIQECITFISPKIMGGYDCMTPFSDFKFISMKEVLKLNLKQLNRINDDICLRSILKTDFINL